MPAVTVQQLTDAALDVTALAAVVNGSDTAADVVTRTGPAIKTLAKAIKNVGGQLAPIGAYDSSHTYAILNAVSFGGNSYVSSVNGNLNNNPATTPSAWMMLAAKGDHGIDGGIGGATLASAIPLAGNLIDYTTAVVGIINSSDGSIISSYTGYHTTGFSYVGHATQAVANFIIFGVGYYDINQAFISAIDISAPLVAGTVLNFPSGTVYVKIGMQGSAFLSTMALAPGTVFPSYIPAFGFIDRGTAAHDIAVSTAAINATIAALPSAAAIRGLTDSEMPANANVFDYQRQVVGIVNSIDGSIISSFTGYATSDFIYVGTSGVGVTNFVICGVGYYDVNRNFISAIDSSVVITANTTLTFPAGTVYVRIGTQGVLDSSSAIMLLAALPGSVPKYINWQNIVAGIAAQLGAVQTQFAPYAGKNWFVTGDSITAAGQWQAAAAPILGITESSVFWPASVTQRGAYSGGTTYAANDLVYTGTATGTYWLSLSSGNVGHTPASSPTFWQNVNLASNFLGHSGHPMSDAYLEYATNLAANPSGPTVLKQLTDALADKDLMYIFYGTNDQATPLGALGDAPVAPGVNTSFYGSCEYAVQTALTAINATGRTIQLVLITPYRQARLTSGTTTTLAQVVKAIQDVGGKWGVPVFDLSTQMPINTITWPTLLDPDTIHPKAGQGFAALGSFIARRTIPYAMR